MATGRQLSGCEYGPTVIVRFSVPVFVVSFALSSVACGNEKLRHVEECQVAANHEKPEICNNVDDNCNCTGDTNRDSRECGPGDEGVDEGCDDDSDGYCDAAMKIDGRVVICLKSFDACPGGTTCYVTALDCDDQTVTSYPGAPETCDGQDNDCDGLVDADDNSFSDPLIRADGTCLTGAFPAAYVGIGACRAGQPVCKAGQLECAGEVGPEPESCNAKDDDCNGLTDDGAGAFAECVSSNNPLVGECHPGFHMCRFGRLDTTVCVGELLPQAESCNAKDDDCDGQTDEGTRSTHKIYVLFHLDCSGSMTDKISQITSFLNDLVNLPPIYQAADIEWGLVLLPDDSSGQLPWVHQKYTDLTKFRASLATVTTSCGWMEPNIDSVAYGLCSSRPTVEWPAAHQCRRLYDSHWQRCGGASGNPASYGTGTICESVLTGGYLNGRIYDLPVPDGASQLHVLFTDEEDQTGASLTASDVAGIRTDLRNRYATQGWTGTVKTACFLDSYYSSQFTAMCDSTHILSSSSTPADLMAGFTQVLQVTYCQ